MAKGVPSASELEKALIINTFTTVLGIVIGLALSNAWKTHQAKQNQLKPPTGIFEDI